MKLIWNGLTLVFNIFCRGMSKGKALNIFCRKMGIAYIKFAQIMAMQNIDNVFTEQDRLDIMSICDSCDPIPWKSIEETLSASYPIPYKSFIKKIQKRPIGSASVSQVHRAVLNDGRKVVFKIKRKDISAQVYHDIEQIKRIIRRFGWIYKFSNFSGTRLALDYYVSWINQEIDFINEVKNIKRYTAFAESVNGTVEGCVKIVVPKVYEEYCTEDVICMEYIPHKTIMHMDMNDPRIIHAFNSYIKLSFYALLHNMPVVFHGDPHGGNVYIDDNGNIGFLDMGLIFELNKHDHKSVCEYFFYAYLGKADKLYNELVPYLHGDRETKKRFYADIVEYCNTLHLRPLTAFFMDMVVVCFKYSITPPSHLFGMAKAFVCLGGVDTIYSQTITGHNLLREQVNEYLANEFLNMCDATVQRQKDMLRALAKRDRDSVITVMTQQMEICRQVLAFLKK